MIRAVDSSASRPGQSQIAQAARDGLGMWCGYLAVLSNVGLYAPWDDASIARVKALPARPIMFASGRDDPVAIRNRAAALGVLVGLDVESGIRGDGDWVQGWLDAAGAGLYGALSVHWHPGGRRAAFNIVADYPGQDPGRIWPPGIPRPDGDGPLGWQWQGTHDAWGCSVDALWLDDRFAGGGDVAQLDDIQASVNDQWAMAVDGVGSNTGRVPLIATANAKLDAVLAALGVEKAAIAALGTPVIDEAALIAALLAGLTPHLQVIDEAALLAHIDTLPPATAAAVRAGFAKALAG